MIEGSRLTARQRAFLDKLLELYRERKSPVHYSDVAERLGVNRFSAYDMLKVLEKKGFTLFHLVAQAPNGSTTRRLLSLKPYLQLLASMNFKHRTPKPL